MKLKNPPKLIQPQKELFQPSQYSKPIDPYLLYDEANIE